MRRSTRASSASREPPPANHNIEHPDLSVGLKLGNTPNEQSLSSQAVQGSIDVFLADNDAEDVSRLPAGEGAIEQLSNEPFQPEKEDRQGEQPAEEANDRQQTHPIHKDNFTRDTSAFSDSAYVSASNAKNRDKPYMQRQAFGQDSSLGDAAEPSRSVQDGQCVRHDLVENAENGGTSLQQNEIVADNDDNMTYYSDDGSTSTVLQDIYTSQIVDNLIAELKLGRNDIRGFDRLSSVMPQMLKAFAYKIGYKAEKKELLDAMVFFNKYSAEITQCFNEQVSGTDPRAEAEKEQSPVVPGASTLSLLEKINKWRMHVGTDGPEIGESDDFEIDEPVVPSVEIVQLYKKLIVGTPAHQWLVANLRKELSLKTAYPNLQQQIADAIKGKVHAIPKFRHLSRHRAPEPCHATFAIDWDPVSFLQEQEYEYEFGESLQAAVVLVGNDVDGQACTCAQYVCQTWPTTGHCTLELLSELVTDPTSSKRCKWPDGTQLVVQMDGTKVVVDAIGPRDSVAEVATQLSWLAGALRSSPAELGMAYCTASVRVQGSHQLGALKKMLDITCEIGVDFSREVKVSEDGNGKCWHHMFRNPVVVEGFPIPYQDHRPPGLEVPLDVMAKLVQTSHLDIFREKLFIKGFSSMLIPTDYVSNVIAWHLIYNQTGGPVSYSKCNVEQLPHITFNQVEEARHIIGWCGQAKCHAGTPDANLDIGRSRLLMPHSGCMLEKVSITGGKPISASLSIAVGTRDKPLYIPKDNYEMRLNSLAQQFVVLWEEREKRGWLVNGLNALWYLVRSSLYHNQHDPRQPPFLLDEGAIKEEASVMETLTNADNMMLKIYSGRGQREEKTTYKNAPNEQRMDLSERVTEDNNNFYRLQDRIEDVCRTLTSIIDNQVYVAGQNGVKLKGRIRKHLEGYDFKDLAKFRNRIDPRVATLAAVGYGWVDFIRAIQAIVLFGTGFGDLIQPANVDEYCDLWSRLPKGQYYLAACTEDVENIIDLHGDPDTVPMRISNDLLWHNPSKLFETCLCKVHPEGRHSDPVQTIWPTKIRRLLPRRDPIHLNGQGAVIFGHNVRFLKWRWPEIGDPIGEEIRPPAEGATCNTQDSNIGSSVSSSGLRHTDPVTGTRLPITATDSNASSAEPASASASASAPAVQSSNTSTPTDSESSRTAESIGQQLSHVASGGTRPQASDQDSEPKQAKKKRISRIPRLVMLFRR
ncbi:MAG: hypothetical protein M1822_005088 [Bathelium mastoideum]|nr:MAG: hypothetical protein M1822_005088 [Bathelium mastoideum]